MCTLSGNSEFFLLLRFHSRTACQAFLTLALRDWPRWIIANVSRERGDTSEMLSLASRFCIRRMLLMNFSRASPWEILRTNDKSPYLREGARREVCWEGKKKEKEKRKYAESTRTRRVLWRFFGISLSASRWDIGSSSSDIPRELPRGIPSWGGPRNVDATVAAGWRGETVISVVLRSVEELWESPAKHPVSNTFPTK